MSPTPEPLQAPRWARFRTSQDTELAVSASQLLGDSVSAADGGQVSRTADVSHGVLLLGPDGSFSYRPEAGYIGLDSFRYVLTVGDRTSLPVEVTIEIEPLVGPSAAPGIGLTIGSIDRGGPTGPDVTFGSLGPLAFSFEWLIPSLVVSVPGLLVLIAIGAQMLAGAAWLPLVRRDLGDFGLGTRRRRGDAPLA